MPGSLASSSPPLRGVTRHESTRSDSSAASNTSQSSAAGNKKVSFNKAVRVKKYPRPKKNEPTLYDDDNDSRLINGDANDLNNSIPGSPGKRFWFKVYRNKHRQAPDPNEFRKKQVIYYGNDRDVDNDNAIGCRDDIISYHPNPSVLNYPPPVLTSDCGTQTPNRKTENSSRTALLGNEFTPLHPSQMPSDPPSVQRNHVKKIVHRFNEEAVLQRQRSSEGEHSPPVSPPGSPRQHSTPKHIPIPPPPPPPIPPAYERSKAASTEGLFSSKFKRNPIVNGVKVMFGMGQLKKNEKSEQNSYKNYENLHSSQRNGIHENKISNGTAHHYKKGPYRTEIVISDGSETEVKTPYPSYEKFHYGEHRNGHNEIVKRNDKLDFNRFDTGDHYDDDYDYRYFDDDADRNRKSKYRVETWDSGNQLVFDTTDVNTATAKTDKGEFTSTVGEKHQLWKNNKRVILYEENSPTITRRKAKSHSDLSHTTESKHSQEDKLDKGVSTDELFIRKGDKKETLTKKQKDSWLKHFKSSTKDKGIQCNKIPTDEPEELYGFGRYKIIRPRNGVVTAFSNVPLLDKTKSHNHTISNQTNGYSSKDSAIYSQIDKSKKKKNTEKEKKKSFFSEESRIGGLFKSRSEPLYIGPPPKSQQQNYQDEIDDIFYEDRGERKIKTSKRSFGFRLNTGKDDDTRDSYKNSYGEEDWYNVDGDVEAVERQKRKGHSHRDIAEVRQELAEPEVSDTSSLSNGENRRNAGAVMREVDYKKKEISYENVPRSENEPNHHPSSGSGLWYRDADEDYRREMAQSEVSYPAGNSVGSDRFYTIDRREKVSKKLPPPSPRAYTLDRRHLKSKDKQKTVPNTSGVKILVNGKEIREKSSGKKQKNRVNIREDPSSVQSDPLYFRGGLAAAYQARQRAAVRRSNSTTSGISNKYRSNSPNIRRIQGSSEISAASSESDSGRHRRPLVMYIPGISHPEKSSDNDDRVSGASIARSQSMMTSARPSRVSRRSNQKSQKGSKMDLYRNGDIYEEDEIMPLASDRRKPPKVPAEYKKHNDIKRRHSMPKDTKFSWLKWRIRGKPSREP